GHLLHRLKGGGPRHWPEDSHAFGQIRWNIDPRASRASGRCIELHGPGPAAITEGPQSIPQPFRTMQRRIDPAEIAKRSVANFSMRLDDRIEPVPDTDDVSTCRALQRCPAPLDIRGDRCGIGQET